MASAADCRCFSFSIPLLPNRYLFTLCFLACIHLINLVHFAAEVYPSCLSPTIMDIYVFFVSVGTFLYFFGSSVFLYLPYAHGSEIAPSSRFDYFCLGVALNFLFHTFPLVFLQFWSFFVCSLNSSFSYFVFFSTLLAAFASFLLSWFAYACKISDMLQNYFVLRENTKMGDSGLLENVQSTTAFGKQHILDNYALNQI